MRFTTTTSSQAAVILRTYYLTIQGDCKKNGIACVRYQRGQCTDCLPGFKLKGNVCDMEGCTTMGSNLQCTECETKKYVNVNYLYKQWY